MTMTASLSFSCDTVQYHFVVEDFGSTHYVRDDARQEETLLVLMRRLLVFMLE